MAVIRRSCYPGPTATGRGDATQTHRLTPLVVTFHTPDQLHQCLASLQREGATNPLVIDNGIDHETPRMVSRDHPDAHYVRYSDNPGYGTAVNRGRRGIVTPYMLVLNADTEVRAGTLEALSAYFDEHPRVGLVGPRLRDPTGQLEPSCYPRATPWQLFMEESRLGRLVRFIPWIRHRHPRTWPHDHDRRVEWVLGAALALRMLAFDEVGGFDGSYFLYYEEVDLCERLRDAGWEVHFTPSAEVVHVGAASTSRLGPKMSRTYFSSVAMFYGQRRGRLSWFALRAVVTAIASAQLVRRFLPALVATRSFKKANQNEGVRAWCGVLLDARAGWPATRAGTPC